MDRDLKKHQKKRERQNGGESRMSKTGEKFRGEDTPKYSFVQQRDLKGNNRIQKGDKNQEAIEEEDVEINEIEEGSLKDIEENEVGDNQEENNEEIDGEDEEEFKLGVYTLFYNNKIGNHFHI